MPSAARLEALAQMAPLLQDYLSLQRALELRCLSKDICDGLESSEGFWLALLRRAGFFDLYATCKLSPADRRRFLGVMALDLRRWSLFLFDKVRDISTIFEPRICVARTSRAPAVAQRLGRAFTCAECEYCTCDTDLRLIVTVPNQQRNQFSLNLVDDHARTIEAPLIASRFLPEKLWSYSPAPVSTHILGDGCVALIWERRRYRQPLESIISIHLPFVEELPYLYHYTLPMAKRVRSLAAHKVSSNFVVGCEDGSVLLYPAGSDSEPVEIYPSSHPIERISMSRDCKLIVFEELQGLSWTVLENFACEWRRVLLGFFDRQEGSDLSLAWELNLDLGARRGFGGQPSEPKKRERVGLAKAVPSRAAAAAAPIAEGVMKLGTLLLAFPIISARDESLAFPDDAARLFTLRGHNNHEFAREPTLHYFPPDDRFFVFPWPEAERESRVSIGGLAEPFEEFEAGVAVVRRSSILPPFMWLYHVGAASALYRWKHCWVACVKDTVRLFWIDHSDNGPVSLTQLAGHRAPIYRSALDPSTDRLITIDLDEIAILWSLCRGRKIATYDLLDFPTEEEIAAYQDGADQECEQQSGEEPQPEAAAAAANDRLPPIAEAALSDADFPALAAAQPAQRRGAWSATPAILRQRSEQPVHDLLWDPDEADGPAMLVELSRSLNIPMAQLVEGHAQQVMWESARAVENQRPLPTEQPRKMITSVALELASRFVPEKFLRDAVLNSSSAAERRKAVAQSPVFRFALRKLKISHGCVSGLWLTHSSLSMYFECIHRIQTWAFL